MPLVFFFYILSIGNPWYERSLWLYKTSHANLKENHIDWVAGDRVAGHKISNMQVQKERCSHVVDQKGTAYLYYK